MPREINDADNPTLSGDTPPAKMLPTTSSIDAW